LTFFRDFLLFFWEVEFRSSELYILFICELIILIICELFYFIFNLLFLNLFFYSFRKTLYFLAGILQGSFFGGGSQSGKQKTNKK